MCELSKAQGKKKRSHYGKKINRKIQLGIKPKERARRTRVRYFRTLTQSDNHC